MLTLVEIITVGLPFCASKLIAGLHWLSLSPLLYGLVALGALDTLLNLVNAGSVAIAGRRVAPICLTDALFKRAGSTDLGTALDVALSFSLVAVMVGSGAIPTLAAPMLSGWNVSVVLNVLGAGALRLADAFKRG